MENRTVTLPDGREQITCMRCPACLKAEIESYEEADKLNQELIIK